MYFQKARPDKEQATKRIKRLKLLASNKID